MCPDRCSPLELPKPCPYSVSLTSISYGQKKKKAKECVLKKRKRQKEEEFFSSLVCSERFQRYQTRVDKSSFINVSLAL